MDKTCGMCKRTGEFTFCEGQRNTKRWCGIQHAPSWCCNCAKADETLYALTTSDGLESLSILHHLTIAAGERTKMAVIQARQDGASWAAVGSALGMTRQAAHERFGRKGEYLMPEPGSANTSRLAAGQERPVERAHQRPVGHDKPRRVLLVVGAVGAVLPPLDRSERAARHSLPPGMSSARNRSDIANSTHHRSNPRTYPPLPPT